MQRPRAWELEDPKRYQAAHLALVDFWAGSVDVVLTYRGRADRYQDEFPNILFMCADMSFGKLHLCTETEVLIYDYPSMTFEASVSLPSFQNVHCAKRISCEELYVASTGLDMVVKVDVYTGTAVEHINVLGKDPWHRFSPVRDYRKVHSTKPHESHPNFLFEVNGRLYVTRFYQRDAVCINDMSEAIKIGGSAGIHDGVWADGVLYFTSVDGKVWKVDARSLRVFDVVDLNQIEGTSGPLGWCRGILVDGDIAYVGFTRLRKTTILENVRWAARRIGLPSHPRTRVVAYDLRRKVKLGEVVMPPGTVDAIYSLLDAGPG
ncbi:hypothetical protein D6833_09525, partial [Candidatus Parcubacteria bacterium]